MGVHSSVHAKRCVVSCSCVLQTEQSSVVLFEVSTLCRYVLSCARVRRCALVNVASVVFIVGAAVCSSLLICLLLR